MATRNSAKQSDGSPMPEGPPPRLLRPRGICFRCHFPTASSCVCPSSTTSDGKVRAPSTPVGSETVNLCATPTVARKKRFLPENVTAVRNKSKSPSSRRQLFKESSPSGLDSKESISSSEQACLDAYETSSVTSSSSESTSSQALEEDTDTVLPSTSTEPRPSTSSAEPQPSKSKRKKRKLKSVGRHICSVCSKMFGSPGKLNQHMFSHTGEKPFECEKCLKAFSSKFKLVRHLLIHSEERQYSCHMCDRTFHRKDHLKNHLKVHSPVKKTFRCDKIGCLKVYSSLLSFRKHAAVHAAEEGDLECKMCGKSFVTKEEIVYHLKVHAGSRTVKTPSDKKYGCDYCDRRFFTRKDVRRHLVVHTGKRDFLCQFCPHRFGRKDHLVRHIKKSHINVTVVKIGRGKRSRPVSSLEPPQASVPVSISPSSRQRTVLRTHGRSKPSATSDSQAESGGFLFDEPTTQEYVTDVIVDIEGRRFSSDLKISKQDSAMKVEDLMNSAEDGSFQVDHVKVEDCHLLPELQPIIFSQPTPHPSYAEHLAVDDMNVASDQVDSAIKSEQPLSSLPVGMDMNQFDSAIKSEQPLSSLPVGMDMNQFISGFLVSPSDSVAESNAVSDEQPVGEQQVPTETPSTTGMSDAEATEFLAQFSNDDAIMQFMELSIPITSAPTAASATDMNSQDAPLGPLPRFQQAFQQQPP